MKMKAAKKKKSGLTMKKLLEIKKQFESHKQDNLLDVKCPNCGVYTAYYIQ
jgi:hypothetical protein